MAAMDADDASAPVAEPAEASGAMGAHQEGADGGEEAEAEAEQKRAWRAAAPEDGEAMDATQAADQGADADEEYARSDAWTCGANGSGALGTGDACAAMLPKRVRARRAWAQLALGDSHGAGVSVSGQLYCWGLNDRAQTGHGLEAGRACLAPARVEALDGRRCTAVALGFEHSAALFDDGAVYCFGSNEFGQCGAGDGAPLVVATPRLARVPRGGPGGAAHVVAAVACGAHHTLALTTAGAALAWGHGAGGQLGLGDASDRHTPTPVHALWGVPLVALAAGEAHSLALSRLGHAYAWGRAASGALGLTEGGDGNDADGADLASDGAAGGDADDVQLSSPAPAAVVAALLDMGIDRALAEEAAAAAPGVEAAVEWAFEQQARRSGANAGALVVQRTGMSRGAQLLPRRVTVGLGAPGDAMPQLAAIAAGASHSVFVEACGDVYTCGGGASGALGHGGSGSEPLPRRIQRLVGERRVVAAAAGAAHTLLLCADGTALVCGAGEDGALGLEDARDKAVPLPLPLTWHGAPRDARVAAIAAGGYASAFILREGPGEPLPPPTIPCPAAALERALAAAEANGAAGERMRSLTTAIDAALGCARGAAAAFALPAHRDGDSAALRPLIATARLEALSVRALSLGIRVPEVVAALRGAQERLVAELASNAAQLQRREHAAALAVAAHNPLLSGAASGAPLLRALCPLLAGVPRPVRALLRAGWAATPAALLASRTVRPLQAFISAEITSSRATTPAVVAAIRVLAIAHAANEAPGRAEADVLPAEEFYNSVISDNFNVAEDFQLWVNGGAAFTFCAHPFLLGPGAKARLLRLEAALRMQASVEASRAAAVAAMFRLPTGTPRWLRFLAGEVGSPFGGPEQAQEPSPAPAPAVPPAAHAAPCDAPPPDACGVPATHPEACVLRVRRARLVEDALAEVARQSPDDVFKPLRVHFIGEDGVDAGGLRKEFFQLLLWQLMSPERGLFTHASDVRARWLAPDGPAGGAADAAQQSVWRLVGTVLGLAVFNGIILELHLPRAFFKKLLGVPLGLADLEAFEPTVGRSLRQLLAWQGPGSVEDTFCLTFVHEGPGADGATVTTPLEAGGERVAVTEANRERYVALYAAHVLTRSCARAFDALRASFMALCGGRALRLVSPAELETLVCGTPHLDFKALEAAARYSGGWGCDHATVRAFWSVVHEKLSLEEQKLLLRFVTGSDRAPIGGLAALSVLITRDGPDSGRLPTSHTCFCQLCLPEYGSRAKLADRLRTAITNAAEGFGLT